MPKAMMVAKEVGYGRKGTEANSGGQLTNPPVSGNDLYQGNDPVEREKRMAQMEAHSVAAPDKGLYVSYALATKAKAARDVDFIFSSDSLIVNRFARSFLSVG